MTVGFNRRRYCAWGGAVLVALGCLAYWCFRNEDLRQQTFRIGFENAQMSQFVGPGGKPMGPAIEIVQEAARRGNIKLQWVQVHSGPDAALRTGSVDLWPIFADFADRRSYAHISAAWRVIHYWSVRAGPPKRVRKIATLRTGAAARIARQYFPGAELLVYATQPEALAAVCSGVADRALAAEGTSKPSEHSRPSACETVELRYERLPDASVRYGTAASLRNPLAARAADAIREEIRNLAMDGTLASIHFRWSLPSASELLAIEEFDATKRKSAIFTGCIAILLIALIAFIYQNRTIRKAHQRAEEARQLAERAAAIKADFLANMSHEIRTPMNGILGTSDLLLDSPLGREQKEYAQTIRSCASALLTILDDVLDCSKLEAGKLVLERAEFSLLEVAESALNLLGSLARDKQLELFLKFDQAAHGEFLGDAVRLRQVILNLVGNAIKFTSSGHVMLSVSVKSSDQNRSRVRVEVQDTGIGISPEALSRLFQKFTQADASTTRKYGGTGLGLSISKQLVENMGGEIGVGSETGSGSCFWFEVPLEAVSGERVGPALPPELRNVLIVSGNSILGAILAEQLEQWSVSSETASGSRDAEEKLRPGKYDLVLSDEQPVERVFPWGLPTVFLSREAMMFQIPQSCAWIRKPVTPTRLATAMSDVLRSTPVPQQAVAGTATTPFAGLRVLVVEDNAVNQKLVVKMLQKLGCSADVAVNGVEAIERAPGGNYGIVLMDCQMPEMDGFEATRLLKEQYSDRIPPIVALTAAAMPEHRQMCADAGMDDFVTKPISLQRLSDVLDRWANHVGDPRKNHSLRYIQSPKS